MAGFTRISAGPVSEYLGTRRDSFRILDGLLEQETALRPVEVASGTHGAGEIACGLFRLAGGDRVEAERAGGVSPAAALPGQAPGTEP